MCECACLSGVQPDLWSMCPFLGGGQDGKRLLYIYVPNSFCIVCIVCIVCMVCSVLMA